MCLWGERKRTYDLFHVDYASPKLCIVKISSRISQDLSFEEHKTILGLPMSGEGSCGSSKWPGI